MSRIFAIIVLLAVMVAGSSNFVSAQNDSNDGPDFEWLQSVNSRCLNDIKASGEGSAFYSQSIENDIVEIDTRSAGAAHFSDVRTLENLDLVRGMDLVVEPGQHIRSTEPLDGILWVYPPTCEFTDVIEFVVRDRDYRASYDVPIGWFFADWHNVRAFEKVANS